MDLSTLMKNEICSIAILKFNKDFMLKMYNKRAERLIEHGKTEAIIQAMRNRATHFCLLQYECEVEVLYEWDEYTAIISDFTQIHGIANITIREFNEVFHCFYDGLVISDAEGKLIYQNHAARKLTQLSEEQVIGKSLDTLIGDSVIDRSASLQAIKEKKTVTIVQTLITGNKVLVTGVPLFDEFGNVNRVVCSIRDLTKLNQLEQEVSELEKKHELANKKLEELRDKQLTQNSIVAYDKRMKEVLERALRVARVDSTILVTGESGVGKEGIVHYIHENSNRRHAKLVKINCGAIPEQLLESELFGYSPGAFTGANSKGKKGLFEIASGGTIFLDEIGEMPLSLQVKLLRVIQEGEMTKVGDIAPMKVDIRIIVATNRDLKKEVENKRFREDLYYRLNIIPIHVPPLRERKDDIIPLVYHFLNKLKEKYGIHRIFSGESLRQIESYHWPGNVRELQNFIERLCLVVNKPVINLEDIRNEWNFNLLENETHPSQNDLDQSQNIYPLKRQLEDYEKEIIIKTLQQCPSMRQAAKALQIDPSTLLRKMQKYNIQR